MIVDDQHQVLMQEPGATRLTFDGQLALAGVTARDERDVRFSTLIGAEVRVTFPPGWKFQGVSAHVVFEHRRDGPGGFQRVRRGSAVLMLLGDHEEVYPDSLVNFGDGKLAHYRLDWGAEAVAGFTVWQGPWSDVFTSDHETFDEALEAFRRVMPRDAPGGAVLDPPVDWTVRDDEVTIDCGTLVINAQRRDEAVLAPWNGAQGARVEMYRMDDLDQQVLAVSPSAVAAIGRATGHDPVTDQEVAEIAEGFDIQWTSASTPQ